MPRHKEIANNYRLVQGLDRKIAKLLLPPAAPWPVALVAEVAGAPASSGRRGGGETAEEDEGNT